MPDETVQMYKGDERKAVPAEPNEIAKHMHCGWRQVEPTPLQQAPAPHEQQRSEETPKDCAVEPRTEPQ